jgi:hypothetical protein
MSSCTYSADGDYSCTASTTVEPFATALACWRLGCPAGSACRSSDDCQGTMKCTDDVCAAPKTPKCWSAGGCPTGTACRNYHDCKSGANCTKGKCTGSSSSGDGGGGNNIKPQLCWDYGCPPGKRCRDSSDCDQGLYCTKNVCSRTSGGKQIIITAPETKNSWT